MATTENITVLFTDLVGSTELASSLSPEVGDEVRRKHFSALRQAIATAGGTEIKNLGDGFMVVFRSASAALSCAVAMQQAVDRDNAGALRPQGLRVGLSAGEAAREADDYFGDPVIEAARLCAKAVGGQILAADLVRANAGRRSPHVFSSLGEFELKGLPGSIETLEVGWEPLRDVEVAASVVPLPARLEIAPITGVVARDAEAEILTDALKRVAAGEGREVVLISGEAGLGKTTLVAEAARRGLTTGACVLLGRCQEDLSAPYALFAEALHHYVVHAPDELLAAHVGTHGGELAKMVPALRQRLGVLPETRTSDPDTERYLLYGAVVGLLAEASANQPLVLVLDDLQWADKPSLQLLRHVASKVESARLLVLATFRDAELSGSHPLIPVLGALRREPGVRLVDLKGFDDTGVLAFMEAASGQRLETDEEVGLAHALYRETDGNPFFVGEILRDLIETNEIYQDDTGRWVAAGDLSEMALPSSVRQVISARVARLGERAGRALSFAAVIGRDFDFDLLDAVIEVGQDELLDVLDAAMAAALVREVPDVPGRWSFSHALIQHTLYQDQGATRRARAHRRVAEALEILCGNRPGERVGELAHHWSNATQPVDAAKAISYARQAAEAALEVLAPDEAVRYFTQALGFVGQQPQADHLLVVDLLIGLGTAQALVGLSAFRETLLDAAHQARELGATDRLVAAALANNRGFVSAIGVIDTQRVEVLEAALAAVSEVDSPERAHLLAMLCAELTYGSALERRRSLADEARAMARRLGDPTTLISVLTLVRTSLWVPWLHAELTRDSAEAYSLAETLGDPFLSTQGASGRQIQAVRSGDFELAQESLDAWQEANEQALVPAASFGLRLAKVSAALMAGDPDRAEQLATEAFDLGTASGQPDAFGFYSAQLAIVRHQQGRLGELMSFVEQAVAENPGLVFFQGARCLTALEAQENRQALKLLGAAAADGFAHVPEDANWLDTLICYAEVAMELQPTASAERLLELLEPFANQIPYESVIAFPPVAFYVGGLASVLGRYDEADTYFVQAADFNTRGQMKFAEVRTQLAHGRMLLRRGEPGDVSRASELLELARTAAVNSGYLMVEQRAVGELATLT